jgi:hypothetical protein
VDQQANRGSRSDPRATLNQGRLSGSRGVTPSLKVTALGVSGHNFPALDIDSGFNLIANHYLCTLSELEAAGTV